MIYYRVLSYLFVILLLFSCDDVNRKKELSLTDKNNVEISVKDGINETYHENGSLRSSVKYRKGKKQGIEEVFYSNGVIKERLHYLNGFMFGDQYWYDTLGVPILYQFHNIEGISVFKLDLTSLESFGNPIYHIYNRNNLTVGDTLESLFYLAIPKGSNHEFSCRVIDESLESNSIENVDVESSYKKLKYANVYSIDKQFEKSGIFKIETRLSFSDSLNLYHVSDSASFQVKIK